MVVPKVKKVKVRGLMFKVQGLRLNFNDYCQWSILLRRSMVNFVMENHMLTKQNHQSSIINHQLSIINYSSLDDFTSFFHQDNIFPLSVEFSDFFTDAYDSETVFLMKFDRSFIFGEDIGL